MPYVDAAGNVKPVSMKSGLEDRNNVHDLRMGKGYTEVSMKSGLEDRNNNARHINLRWIIFVSMKSGLEDRNKCRQR